MAAKEDWDTSKENIQPLRQGRLASAASLADISEPKMLELSAKRQDFERRIKETTTEDPLAEWDTYIQWVEANYPRGGKESGYSDLLMKCCQHFVQQGKDSKHYFQDERFVKIWIKFAKARDAKQVLETFEFMEKEQIGTQSPDFYLAWASELESVRATVKAEEILDRGIEACSACPENAFRLQTSKKALLDRDARALVSGSGTLSIFTDELEEERTTLGALRGVGKDKREAPVNRVGESKLPMTKGVVTVHQGLKPAKPSIVSIYTDDAQDESQKAVADDESTFPSIAGDRENVVLTTKIEKAQNVKRKKIVPVPAEMAFQIHSDPSEKPVKESRRLSLDHRRLAARDRMKEEVPLESILQEPLIEATAESVEAADRGHMVDWAVTDYKDPGAVKREPAMDRLPTISSKPFEAAPPPPVGQVFVWSYSLFQEAQELSIEEGLTMSYRKTRFNNELAQNKEEGVKQQEKSLAEMLAALDLELTEAKRQRQLVDEERISAQSDFNYKQKMLDERLSEAELEHSSLERLRLELNENKAILDERLKEAAEKLEEAEQLKIDADIQYKCAYDIHESNEQDLFVTESIMNGLSSCLTALHKDIAKNDMEPWDCVLTFTYDLQRRLERISENQRHSAAASVNMMLEVLNRILDAIEHRQPNEGDSMENKISPKVSEERMNAENPEHSENIVLSQGTATWQSSQPVSGRQSLSDHPSNAAINAMWNQTLNGTNKERSAVSGMLEDDPPSGEHVPSDRRHSYAVPVLREGPYAVHEILGLPVESFHQPFDIYQDPPSKSSSCLGFEIFEDEAVGKFSCADHSNLKDRLAEDNDEAIGDDRDISPHLFQDCTDVVKERILASDEGSQPNSGETENNVCDEGNQPNSGETEDNSEQQIRENGFIAKKPDVSEENIVSEPPSLASEATPEASGCKVRTNAPSLKPTDEFNMTRKSMGCMDQTIQLESESQFFDNIDMDKCMASTPKTGCRPLVEDQSPDIYRRRQSYYPLSPILEGSRENKTSSSSNASSTMSTHLRSKKSTGNFEVVDEQEELSSVDPYCAHILEEFRERLRDRIKHDPLIMALNEGLQDFVPGKTVLKLDQKYNVEEQLGQGSYAKVYRVRSRSDASTVFALKVQPTAGWWDQYIHSEILRRLGHTLDSGEIPFIINAHKFFRLNDDTAYNLLPLYEHDTILKLVTAFQKSTEKSVPEPLCMKLTLDVLRAVESIHSVGIIHGDIKADNFLIQNLGALASAQTAEEFAAIPSVVLTDFGCGIDTTLFEPRTTFSTIRKGKTTAGYEILQNHPWTYEIDLFGVLDVIHTLLFGEYMKIYEEGGVWKITKSCKRSYSEIWAQTFNRLLNIKSANDLPDISEIRREFEETTLRRVQMMNVTKLSRQIRVTFFMQRKSCAVSR